MKKYLFISVIFTANYISGFTQSSSQTRTDILLQDNVIGTLPVSSFQNKVSKDGPIVLRGTILLPEGVLRHGYVAIVNGLIASITDNPPDLANAVTVNTQGIILPGFVDVHNHITYNVLPRWNPGTLYANRSQWRTDPEVLQKIEGPIGHIKSSHSCEMNKWGELRALVGGATSTMVTRPEPCINGLVRNLDFNSGFYGTTELDREHIYNVLDLPPASDPAARAYFVGAANYFIANPFYEALFIHLAEGTDAAAEEEFTFLQSQSLLNPKGVVIHGISLTPTDFQAMAAAGTALVWSPRSNLELYGQTANINAALDAGVEIALAPDWAVTGSSNMLNELKVAAKWNHERLGGRLTDRQLVEMVTSTPAHMAGVDDQVGAISVGLHADIVVIKGNHNNPYRAVIEATVADMQLAFIDGVPLYGERTLMKDFWDQSELEEIELPEAKKVLATPAAGVVVANIESSLQLALHAEGTSLAPLSEPDGFLLPAAKIVQMTTSQKIGITKAKTGDAKLSVIAFTKPGESCFTLKTQSSSGALLQVRLMDVSGRILETNSGVVPNITFHIGNNVRPGIYIVEVMQGTQRQTLKLARQ